MRKILPHLLAWLTNHPRYEVSFTWSNLWVHNAFRLFEVIFWRKCGSCVEDTIRKEGLVSFSKEEDYFVIEYTFFTWEAFLAHVEGKIRSFLKVPKLNFGFVWLPIFATDGVPFKIPIFNFSIAFGAIGEKANVSPISIPLTLSGSDLLIVGNTGTQNTISSVKWNTNDAFTLQGTLDTGPASTIFSATYYIANAAAVSSNVVVTTGSGSAWGSYEWFSGCSHTQPDNYVDWTNNTSASSYGGSITTVANNSWVFMPSQPGSGTSYTGGGSNTIRGSTVFGVQGDSNGPKTPAGSVTMTVNITAGSNARNDWALFSFAPIGGGGGVTLPFKTLIGVGK